MSLIQNFMVANNTEGQDLILSPLAGQSLLVKAIYVSNTETGYATIEIQKSTVGYFRVDAVNGNHLSPPTRANTPDGTTLLTSMNLLEWMRNNSDFRGYPVGEGETFRVTSSWTANARITVVYEVYNAGDQLPGNPDGSAADTYHIVNYISVNGGVSSGGYALFNDQLTPPQFPAFPSVSDVPSNTSIRLLGVIGWSIGYTGATAGNSIATGRVKLTRERTVLFDENKLGIPNFGVFPTATSQYRFGTGLSVFGNPSNVDNHSPFVLPVPLVFSAGDTLRVEENFLVQGTPPALTADQVALGFIEQIKVQAA